MAGICDKIMQRLLTFSWALAYTTLFFSILAVGIIFVMDPVFLFLRSGVISVALDADALFRWAKMVAVSSVAMSLGIFVWAEYESWKERKNGR